jgi:hypothetical protein
MINFSLINFSILYVLPSVFFNLTNYIPLDKSDTSIFVSEKFDTLFPKQS